MVSLFLPLGILLSPASFGARAAEGLLFLHSTPKSKEVPVANETGGTGLNGGVSLRLERTPTSYGSLPTGHWATARTLLPGSLQPRREDNQEHALGFSPLLHGLWQIITTCSDKRASTRWKGTEGHKEGPERLSFVSLFLGSF